MSSSIPKLFQSIRVGTANLQHRVVLAPMTRNRANDQHVPGALALEYYKQRTSVPGTLAITEATFIAPQAAGYKNVPGIWSDEQISGWLPVRSLLTFPDQDTTTEPGILHSSLTRFLIITGRGRGAQKWIVHIPSTLGTRTHRTTRSPTRGRRVSTRCAQPDPTRPQIRFIYIGTRSARSDGGRDRGVRATVCYRSSERRPPRWVRRRRDPCGKRISPGSVLTDEHQ